VDNREIDKLIAEKVMGWFSLTDANHMEWWAPTVEEFPIWLKSQRDFRPSTDIKDAWLVVELLQARYEFVEIHIEQGKTNVTISERFFNGYLKDRYQGYEDSTPMAICKAALKAVGVEV